MFYVMEIEVQWFDGDNSGSFRVEHSCKAVSNRHAINKGLAFGASLPGYSDRKAAGFDISLEAGILRAYDPIKQINRQYAGLRALS